MNSQKKWFTLIEIIIIISVVSVWIVIVVSALNNANKYLQKSREKIIAINLAREWIEEITNIRDSNRKKNAWKRDESRLKLNPMDSNDKRFTSGTYIILSEISGGQQYFYGSGSFTGFDWNLWNTINNNKYSLCQNNWIWSACPWMEAISPEGKYYRRVRSLWLFQKETNIIWWTPIDCTKSSDQWDICGDSSAKEYHFCVDVDYIWENVGNVELCSVLTNFKN